MTHAFRRVVAYDTNSPYAETAGETMETKNVTREISATFFCFDVYVFV